MTLDSHVITTAFLKENQHVKKARNKNCLNNDLPVTRLDFVEGLVSLMIFDSHPIDVMTQPHSARSTLR